MTVTMLLSFSSHTVNGASTATQTVSRICAVLKPYDTVRHSVCAIVVRETG